MINGVDEFCYLFGHLHGELLVRNAFGQRTVFLSRVRIQVIVYPRQDAFLQRRQITHPLDYTYCEVTSHIYGRNAIAIL